MKTSSATKSDKTLKSATRHQPRIETLLLNDKQAEFLRSWIHQHFGTLRECAKRLERIRSPSTSNKVIPPSSIQTETNPSITDKVSPSQLRILQSYVTLIGDRRPLTRNYLRELVMGAFHNINVERNLEKLVAKIVNAKDTKTEKSEYQQFLDGFPTAAKRLRNRWSKARKIILIHINGQVFREERVKWFQVETKGQRKGKAYRPPSSVGSSESQGSMEKRLAAEVDGSEMFDMEMLEQLWVFIPSEDQYNVWREVNSCVLYESYKSLKLFWQLYIAKLVRNDLDIRTRTGDTIWPLDIRLFEYPTLGLTGFFFDHDLPSAFFFGARQLFGRDISSERSFSVSAKSNNPGKRHPNFEDVQMALTTLRKISTPVPIPI